jgi:hypothetical protein
MIRAVTVAILALSTLAAQATLSVKIAEPKQTRDKVILKLTLRNMFKEKIESARATIFLLNNDNVAAQATQWVIGGGKDKTPLLPDKTTTYNFVINANKPACGFREFSS